MVGEKCYPCTCTNLLPMYPDYTGTQSNNAMQTTEDSSDVIVSLDRFQRARRLMADVRRRSNRS